jgi:hypothetical protein
MSSGDPLADIFRGRGCDDLCDLGRRIRISGRASPEEEAKAVHVAGNGWDAGASDFRSHR